MSKNEESKLTFQLTQAGAAQATQKYNTQLKPIDFSQAGSMAELTVEVSGTFPGSPAIMQYHLELDGPFIRSLRISG